MSQEDPKDTDSAGPTGSPQGEAPKKKRGFWGWLTGGGEDQGASQAPEAPPSAASEPVGEEGREAADGPAAPSASEAMAPDAAAVLDEAAPAPLPERLEGAAAVPAAPDAERPSGDAEGLVAGVPSPAPEAALAAGTELPVADGTGAPPPPPPEPIAPEPAPPPASEPVALEPAAAPPDLAPPASPAAIEEAPARKGFWSRLASGLARTASNLGQGITDLVSKRKLDAETLEDLEDVLIRADLGVETSTRIVEAVGKGRHDKMISPDEVKGLIAREVETILAPVAQPLVIDAAHRPFVVLMVGVNGSGKTTTIGKLAAQWRAEGRKVVLAAGDTFRAAAIEQLKVWGERAGAHVIARPQGSDAAGVAHDALTEARELGADILMVDTAGRLQNRTELMAELEKVVRVIKKLEPSAPHAVLLVLDATVGQNALSQVEAFARTAGVTGLVMTKLDGTARGGILVAIAAKHKLPIHLIGVGEGADDLQPFGARDFARAIAGLD